MAPLWDALDVETRLGRDLTANEAARLHEGFGAKIEGELVVALNRPVLARDVVETKLYRPWFDGHTITLGATPVQSVQAIQFNNGPSVSPDSYQVLAHGVTIFGPWFASTGIDDFGPATVTVRYRAGLDASALGADRVAALSSVLASRLAREFRYQALNAGREHSSVRVEGADVQFNVTNAAVWDDGELAVIKSCRRRVIR